jgi:hypothetical protein
MGARAAVVACVTMALTPAVASAQRPVVVTGAPTDITSTSATFNGSVTPNGTTTEYAFVYGTTRYTAHTAVGTAGTGSDPIAVTARVDGLTPATTYHARLVAFSREGLAFGDDTAFATLAAPIPVPVPPAPSPAPPPPELTPSSALSGVAAPPPVLGESVNVDERSGAVTVKVPGSADFVGLSKLSSVPVGSLVDTRDGSVTLRSALPGGETQSGVFHGGLFEVRQPKDAKGLTELKLRGAGPSCGAGARAAVVDKRKRKRKRRALWGRDNGGAFRTRGGNSVATVRGTAWYTEDRCDGTLTRVSQGSVTVRDLVNHRTVIVRAGHSYLAPKHK